MSTDRTDARAARARLANRFLELVSAHDVDARCALVTDDWTMPSRGREQVFTATFVHRVVDDRIAETHRRADDLGRVLQLGARLVPADAPT